MKRRSFLGAILALFTAPVVPALAEEKIRSYGQLITIDQMRAAPTLFTGSVGRYEGMALRDAVRADLADWMTERIDRSFYEALSKG